MGRVPWDGGYVLHGIASKWLSGRVGTTSAHWSFKVSSFAGWPSPGARKMLEEAMPALNEAEACMQVGVSQPGWLTHPGSVGLTHHRPQTPPTTRGWAPTSWNVGGRSRVSWMEGWIERPQAPDARPQCIFRSLLTQFMVISDISIYSKKLLNNYYHQSLAMKTITIFVCFLSRQVHMLQMKIKPIFPFCYPHIEVVAVEMGPSRSSLSTNWFFSFYSEILSSSVESEDGARCVYFIEREGMKEWSRGVRLWTSSLLNF